MQLEIIGDGESNRDTGAEWNHLNYRSDHEAFITYCCLGALNADLYELDRCHCGNKLSRFPRTQSFLSLSRCIALSELDHSVLSIRHYL